MMESVAAGTNEAPVVEAQALTKIWPTTVALSDADISIGHGITGLLGANGAGKTTLLGMLLGLHPRTSGELAVLGYDPMRHGAHVRERVGYSPESHELPPDVRAHDLVRHVAEIHGLPRRDAVARSSDALWQVGLGEERHRPISTMSTGQKQRVKLAQSFVHDPDLILLDEPTDGLDPVQRDLMLNLIRRIGTEFGIDVILSSHVLDEVERVCDAVTILSEGRVVASGSLAELRGHGEGVIVEVDSDSSAIAEALHDRGIETRIDGSRIIARSTDPDLDIVVRDVIAASGTGLRRLERRTVSLEDVFLEVGT
ncbi:MAG: Vitamin B12 import ATP-binding protein BtuD [Acidimicrobiales bacterium]|nr:MAG: ABC transporter ATP-binding protein [Actinomycetota bacterium]MBV6509298.1 Vitamin B12 import ATP-binding protein BtuD [Acidimicrobiales bacterium]RIK03977.1 MAG: ABC transporter [Acidobacteriota bacterium]